VAKQFKVVNQVAHSTTAEPKVTPPVINTSSVVTMEQLNKMMADCDAAMINTFHSMQYIASLKKPMDYEPAMPIVSVLVSSSRS